LPPCSSGFRWRWVFCPVASRCSKYTGQL
jgi:hypothetical protein